MATTDLHNALDELDEKHVSTSTITPHTQATLLRGQPVIANIAAWCLKHNNRRKGVKPTLAVVYFDTGDDAEEYLYVKALVAARAGIGYTVHKLHPKAALGDVVDLVSTLNGSKSAHGILIQRPIPSHLSERRVMDSVMPEKHIEEFTNGKANNIALDGLERLLWFYGKSYLLDLDTMLLGGLNIITPAFIAQLKRRHHKRTPNTKLAQEIGDTLDIESHEAGTVILTELNQDSIITPENIGAEVKLVVDLGFDVESKRGDLDPDVLEMEGLLVVPTPGGVLPVLLWIMMERTIRASDRLLEREMGLRGLGCCNVG